MNYEGERFLLKLYKDLDKSSEVKHADKKSNKNSGNKFELLRKYFDRLERQEKIFDGDHLEMEKYLKNRYYDKYVIKKADIPDSYWKFQQKIAFERGYGHIEYTSNMKSKEARILIKEQKKSLEKWIDYLMKENTTYPMWTRYWAFQGMLKLGRYDKEKHAYSKRSKETVTPFIDINPEALALTIGTVQNYYEGKEVDDSELVKLIESGNFGKIYAYNMWNLLESEKQNNKNKIDTDQGIWQIFKKGDAKKLVKLLEGKGTGWCIVGESVAKEYLNRGNMHIYFTKDKKDNYTIPRVCIRQEDGLIAEVRGIEKDQNLEAEMNDITDKKLDEFKDKKEYKKKAHDMKILTEIYNKYESKQSLTDSDYRFIYTDVQGFGWCEDPRLDELRSHYPITDEKFAFEVVKHNYKSLKYMSEELKNNKDIIFEAARNNCYILEYDSEYVSNKMKSDKELLDRLKNDKKFMIQAAGSLIGLQYASDAIKSDKDVVLAAVQRNGRSLRYASDDLKNDKDVVLAAISQYGGALSYVGDELLKNDKEVVLIATRKDPSTLREVSDEFRNDKEIVLNILKNNSDAFGDWLQYVGPNLRGDKELMIKMAKKYYHAALYASDELKKDKDFMLAAVKKYGPMLQYASDELKKDKEVVLAAVRQYGGALLYANDELKKDKEVVLAALSTGADHIRFVDPELQNDEDVIKASKLR